MPAISSRGAQQQLETRRERSKPAKPSMSVHDKDCERVPLGTSSPAAVRGQASGRAAAATDACPGQSPLALELPAAQDAVDAWGQPRRHERPAAPAKARAHRGGVDEGADRRGRQGDDHCYRLGDDGTGAARATKGQAHGGVPGRASPRLRLPAGAGGHRSPVFVRLRRLLPRRAGAHVRDLPGRRHARGRRGALRREGARARRARRQRHHGRLRLYDVLPGARAATHEEAGVPVRAGGPAGGHVRVTPRARRSPSSLRTAGPSSPCAP